jgi:tRNA/tmRNA/rRNA uracil-C5-methylase (TrmA/RlmC/RlmD family)
MDIVMDSFRGIKEQLEGAEIRDILPSPDEFGYRNKIEYSFGDFKS